MRRQFHRLAAIAALCAGPLVLVAAAQPPAQQQPTPQVKLGTCHPIASLEGKDNFDAYCVVCHGKDAKGNGPAAPAMKATVPDLTTIALRHGGKFDALAMEYIITGTGKTATPAHGTEDMPIWGDAFRSGESASRILRIKNLVRYLESIQEPGTQH